MFDGVAARYDLTNDVLSAGQTRLWRRAVVRAVEPGPGLRILDLAAGTGTSSSPFAAAGADVVPCDFSLGMLRVGKQRQPDLPFVAGDALRLPFADGVVRRGDSVLRAAQRAGPRPGPARAAAGHPPGRTAGALRVQPPDLGAAAHACTSST